MTVPASELAREHLGRPIPAPRCSARFAALTGVVSLDVGGRGDPRAFPARLADGNVARRRRPPTSCVRDEPEAARC